MSSARTLPLIVITGRTNVGKSTLFNRITGKRRALVSREPGMTRDRRVDVAEWRGRHFDLVDTGGLEGGKDFLARQISSQASKAVQDSDLVLLVVDGRQTLTAQDQEVISFLRRSNRPVILLVNKMDSPRSEPDTEFYSPGFEKVFAVSAEHGLGVDEVLDYVIERLDLQPSNRLAKQTAISIVIVGKPNAGKSTFLNRLLGEERLIVSEVPGTTRDTIDVEVVHQKQLYRFIDTAGIRKKGATKTVPDKLAVIHARKSLERAEIACIMIDAAEGVTHQDAVVAGYAHTAGKAMIVLLNKIDLLDPPRRKQLEIEVESKLKFISFAPRLYISAKTGQNLGKVFPNIGKVYESYSKRITTGSLNSFFDRALSDRYLGSYKGKPIKLKYITQVGIRPPTFILFTGAAARLHFSHLRYLENQLRRHFGFEGTSIRIKVKRG